jgi:SAM-dependent methyltransferase
LGATTSCRMSARTAGSGYWTGKRFCRQGTKNRGVSDLYAIEPDPSTAELLKETYAQIVPDAQELTATDFDFVILLDVLEHMSQPEQFLASILERLKPGAKILISVPNVAHWSVRLPLLFGFFEYQERGPLDKTHLQFFSKRRFQRLCSLNEKLETIDRSSSTEPLELLLPETLTSKHLYKSISRARQKFAQIFPGLMAYQFLALLRKK